MALAENKYCLIMQNVIFLFILALSYFEIIAPPRIIKDPKLIQIDNQKIQKIIDEIFTCIICKEIFKEPVNSKICLHKFCKKCIENYILKFEPSNKG